MDRFKDDFLPILILFLLVSLVIIFRSFLMAYIIEPVVLLCWVVWRILSGVDQNIYWIVLIVFCSILFIRLIPFGTDKSPHSAYDYTYNPLNRVEYWRTLIIDADLGKNESEYLQDSMKELLITVTTQVERSDPTDSEEMIVKGSASLPLAAQEYLFPSRRKHGRFSIHHQRNIKFLVPTWLRRWTRKFMHQDHSLVDEILRWMETELEINYEK